MTFMKKLDEYFDQLPEPIRGCQLAVRNILLSIDPEIEETWKWSTPFFLYRKKMLCYLWIDKKDHFPYLGIYGGDQLAHPSLVQMHRAKIRKLVIDPEKDLPVVTIQEVIREACLLIDKKLKNELFRNGKGF